MGTDEHADFIPRKWSRGFHVLFVKPVLFQCHKLRGREGSVSSF